MMKIKHAKSYTKIPLDSGEEILFNLDLKYGHGESKIIANTLLSSNNTVLQSYYNTISIILVANNNTISKSTPSIQ